MQHHSFFLETYYTSYTRGKVQSLSVLDRHEPFFFFTSPSLLKCCFLMAVYRSKSKETFGTAHSRCVFSNV